MLDVMVSGWLTTQPAGIFRPELLAPLADRLIGDHDAALEQRLLDKPKAPREPELQPDGMGDDPRWEAVAFVADGFTHPQLIGQTT